MIDWVSGLFVGGAVLAGVLEAAATATPPASPPPQARGEGRCPYCHDALEPSAGARAVREEALVAGCARCATRHHLGCWTEHGGCSVHGCGETAYRLARGAGGRRARPGSAGVRAPGVGPAEGSPTATCDDGADGPEGPTSRDPVEAPATPVGNALPTAEAQAPCEVGHGAAERADRAAGA